jgi:hexosaminidase
MDNTAVKIMDYPRFGWSGIMLDVSRNFFSKEDITL